MHPGQVDFPPTEMADADTGLLTIGGNLTFNTLINAYSSGIFPWYNEGEPVCWYTPDPRFVLFPGDLKISHSMKSLINRNIFEFTCDQSFKEVVRNCRIAKRKTEPGTWITDDIENAYNLLFEKGYAHSAECRKNGKLVGGLYGVQLGKVFFGESMFSNESNASKFALIKYVQHLKTLHVGLIDCQVYTPHLASLGGTFITRKSFNDLLETLIN